MDKSTPIKSHGIEYAILYGKWQPFHNGHLWVVKEILKLYPYVIIGIYNQVQEDLNTPGNNDYAGETIPFTYWERISMISKLFCELRIRERTLFTPVWNLEETLERDNVYLPPKRIREWIIPICKNYKYADVARYRYFGENVVVIDNIPEELLICNSVTIRHLMLRNSDKWKEFVPMPIVKNILSINGPERIRALCKIEGICRIGESTK